MSEEKRNIEEHELFKLTSHEIKPEDLEAVLAKINASDLEEWAKLHLTSRAYMAAGQYENALKMIDSSSLLSKMPEEEKWRAQHNRAKCLYVLNHYKDALDCFVKILEVLKNDFSDNFSVENIHASLAHCYLELGQYQKSLKELGMVLENHPSVDHLWWVYSCQGNCYIYLKQYREALESSEKALENNPPKDVICALYIFQANCRCELREYALGLEACERATEYLPSSKDVMDRFRFCKGRCLLALGQVETAREYFAKSDVKKCDFYCELCDEIINNEGTVKDGILTMRL